MNEWNNEGIVFLLNFIMNEKANLKNGIWVDGQNIDEPTQKEMHNHFTH